MDEAQGRPSPLTRALLRAGSQGRTGFIPFLVGGFPDRHTFVHLLRGLDRAGADIIEVGLPGPAAPADGPVIRSALRVARAAGAGPESVLEQLARLRPGLGAPLLVMTYYRPVRELGLARFARRTRRAGAAGVLIADLPPRAKGAWRRAARAAGLDTVLLCPPRPDPNRLRRLLAGCRGFLYYQSHPGPTGSTLEMDPDTLAGLRRVRRASDLPLAVGFGIATCAQAAALAPEADGVVVGSALVQGMLQAGDQKEGTRRLLALARNLRRALETKGSPRDGSG